MFGKLSGIAFADHKVNGEPVNGYLWLVFDGNAKLVTDNLYPLRWCADADSNQSGLDTLTKTGRGLIDDLAQLGVYEIWSDAANEYVRVQVSETWGTVDRSEKQAVINALRDSILEQRFGSKPARNITTAPARS
jgi:hypothetical protein